VEGIMSRTIFLGFVLLARALVAQPGQPSHGPRGLGAVTLETSCAPSARASFATGAALLHSFGFTGAVRSFNDVLAADSTCAMAYWGLALSAWGNPFAAGIKPNAQLERGLAAVERGRAITGGTERERAYLDAVAKLYDDYQSADQHTRVNAYRDAMADLAARYPRDDEASIFYAAALAFSADPADKTYESQRKAAAILEPLAARYPNHPGIAHYLIHTYDVPALAAKGLPAANRYAVIAPASAHALHMPSHTYTRVGKWEESVATNVRSAGAAMDEGSIGEALHANDYLMYGYLQTGQDRAAARVLAALPALAARYDPNGVTTGAPPAAAYFAMAAIPARYALERGDWKGAAKLEVRESAFPLADAVTWFAKGLGAARTGDTTASAEAVRQLERLRDALTQQKETYWSQQVEIQRRGVGAWLTYARGSRDDALTQMRAVAELEDQTEKSAITPGPIVPARELLGEMLLATGDAAAALAQFEATLTTEPARFRAVAGAMRAAKADGNRSDMKYAAELTRIAEHADRPGRADLEFARLLLKHLTS
jgi:hypothetical protein